MAFSHRLIALSPTPLSSAVKDKLKQALQKDLGQGSDIQLPQVYGSRYQVDEPFAVDYLRELSVQLKLDLLQIPDESIDYRLACFDMDSTLIDAEVIDELAKEAGVGDQVAKITESAMRGELDFNESFQKRMSLLEGLEESVLSSVAARLMLNDGVEDLIRHLQSIGCKTAILSGGFDYFGRFLQKKLGFDEVHANSLDIKDGKVTGKAIMPIVNGDRKAQLLKELAKKESLDHRQVIAVGDGANDLAMLSLAGVGVAFRAKPVVQAQARFCLNHVGLAGVIALL